MENTVKVIFPDGETKVFDRVKVIWKDKALPPSIIDAGEMRITENELQIRGPVDWDLVSRSEVFRLVFMGIKE